MLFRSLHKKLIIPLEVLLSSFPIGCCYNIYASECLLQVGDDVKILDATGKYVMPGLLKFYYVEESYILCLFF